MKKAYIMRNNESTDCTKHKKVNETQKGSYAPKQVLPEQNSCLPIFSFLVYKQLLWGTVYPLAVKAHHTIIRPSSSRGVHYSLMQLDEVLSLCRCAFIIVIHTCTHTHTHMQAHAHTYTHTHTCIHTHASACTHTKNSCLIICF